MGRRVPAMHTSDALCKGLFWHCNRSLALRCPRAYTPRPWSKGTCSLKKTFYRCPRRENILKMPTGISAADSCWLSFAHRGPATRPCPPAPPIVEAPSEVIHMLHKYCYMIIVYCRRCSDQLRPWWSAWWSAMMMILIRFSEVGNTLTHVSSSPYDTWI
jgi:hypothetical protein